MADKKISALTAASTPLAGTEVLPIVQSNATVKVAVSDLTAGRAISATQITLTTGNVIVASGQGIDFSATPGTGTSELFDDYEEGTWTPVDGSGAGVILTVTGDSTYTKIGRFVEVSCSLTIPITASGNQVIIGGLPFTAQNLGGNMQGGNVTFTNRGTWAVPMVSNNNTTVALFNLDGTNATYLSFSTFIVRFFAIYSV